MCVCCYQFTNTALPKVLVSQPITTSYCVWRRQVALKCVVAHARGGETLCRRDAQPLCCSEFRTGEWGLWYLRASIDSTAFLLNEKVICTVILANLQQDISVLFKSVQTSLNLSGKKKKKKKKKKTKKKTYLCP